MTNEQFKTHVANGMCLGYDGLFRYTVGEVGSQRILAPYETDVFSEGYRYTPVSQDELVIINMTDYENFKYKITYLSYDGD